MRQNIADKIGMHVATVSRAVKDKYIQTPAGILPLSAFFSGGIATQDGGEQIRAQPQATSSVSDKHSPAHIESRRSHPTAPRCR
jgi:RNA polymerase sigma-54 factor